MRRRYVTVYGQRVNLYARLPRHSLVRRIIVFLFMLQVAVLDAHFGFSHGAAPMVVIFIEGFDHFSTATQMGVKGWTVGAQGTLSADGSGRFDGRYFQIAAGGGAVGSSKNLPSTYSTVICGFAYFATAIVNNIDVIRLRTMGGVTVCSVSHDASGHLTVKNAAGSVVATGTTVISTSTWNYVELKASVNGASGTLELRLNGAAEIASNTSNNGSTNIGQIFLVSNNSAMTIRFDDFYFVDTTGSAPNNTFLGDVRVETIYPTGAGSHTAWTPNGAASNWDCVDEHTPDDDTTYNSDATPNDIDTYAFGDIDAGATVYGVQVSLYARKDDANTRQIAPVIRQSSTDYVGTTVTMGATYTFYSQLYDQDPTPAAWTASNVNSDEFGVKEIA